MRRLPAVVCSHAKVSSVGVRAEFGLSASSSELRSVPSDLSLLEGSLPLPKTLVLSTTSSIALSFELTELQDVRPTGFPASPCAEERKPQFPNPNANCASNNTPTNHSLPCSSMSAATQPSPQKATTTMPRSSAVSPRPRAPEPTTT